MPDTTPNREVAMRAFAAEFNDATHSFKESDEDRAPTYALLPTGAKANRVFLVGTLTETEQVGDDADYWRGRVTDTTGTFFVYAGSYQPDAAKMLEQLDTPAFVGVVGKSRTWETDEGDVNVSVRPERVMLLSDVERDEWVRETAEQTMDRIEAFDPDSNEYAAMAREEYDIDPETYLDDVQSALETVTGSDAGDADVPDENQASA